MKFTVHKLKIGDIIRAQVVEQLTATEFIVSFQGDLVRVRNESQNRFVLGDKVLVKVLTVTPLTVQIMSQDRSTVGATRINVTV